MNRVIVLSALIGVLTACHSRPVVHQSLTAHPEPEVPAGAPSIPPSEQPTTEQPPVPNAEVANSTLPCLPEIAKPKVAVKRKPRPTLESDKPAPAESQSTPVAASPQVKPIEASVASILGKKVQDANGEDLGRVVDVQADGDGRVRLVIIEFGGFLGVGNRRAAIDWGLLRFHPDDPEQPISLSVSARQVQGTPEFRQASHPRALMAPAAASADAPQPQ